MNSIEGEETVDHSDPEFVYKASFNEPIKSAFEKL